MAEEAKGLDGIEVTCPCCGKAWRPSRELTRRMESELRRWDRRFEGESAILERIVDLLGSDSHIESPKDDDAEVAKRLKAGLERALNMPPKPHKPPLAKKPKAGKPVKRDSKS